MENSDRTPGFTRHVRSILTIGCGEMRGMMKEPVYYVLSGLAAVLIFFSKDFTLFTFDWGSGGDPSYTRTMVREMGLATIFLAGTFIAVMTASRSIFNEIQRKTALSTLSKPVSRTDFILGKYLGIAAGIIPFFLFLSLILLIAVRFQSAQDVEEQLAERTVWDLQIFKGVYLNYLKTCVLTSLSVAVSTRLPFLPNILIVFSVFILCHLLNFLNSFFVKAEGILFYILQLVYALLLNLENYNYFFHGDIRYLPSGFLILLVTVYTVIYSAVFLIIADISFAKRDLF